VDSVSFEISLAAHGYWSNTAGIRRSEGCLFCSLPRSGECYENRFCVILCGHLSNIYQIFSYFVFITVF